MIKIFISLYSDVAIQGESLSFMCFKNVSYLRIFSKSSDSVKGPFFLKNSAASIENRWSWLQSFSKINFAIKKQVGYKIPLLQTAIFNILKEFVVKSFANSKFHLFFKGKTLNKIFTRRFYFHFKFAYSLIFFTRKSFIKEIKNFYLRFFNWLFSYVAFVTKSKSLAKILEGHLSSFFKILEVKKPNAFSNCWFRLSQKKLYYFFNFLRVYMFDYSLMNSTIKNAYFFEPLFYNISYNKDLFLWFLQWSYLIGHIVFLHGNVKQNMNRFYKSIHKIKYIY